MDVRFINPFVGAVQNVFKTMCGIDVRIGKPFLKTTNAPETDVSGIIGFSGDASGSIVMDLSFDVASRLATAFAGIDITPDHEDFADAVGELCNMVAGNAKKEFGEGLNISISLPNVITGKDHSVMASRTTQHIVIPCDCSAGIFHLEVGMVMGQNTTADRRTSAAEGALS